jgi:hypothetical protein
MTKRDESRNQYLDALVAPLITFWSALLVITYLRRGRQLVYQLAELLALI